MASKEKEKPRDTSRAYEPRREIPLELLCNRAMEAKERRARLRQEDYRRRNGKSAQMNLSARELREELQNVEEEIEQMVTELERRTERIKRGVRVMQTPDEEAQYLNEYIGYAYGVAVFVECSDEGAALLCAREQPGLFEIGETARKEDLLPFDDLPDGERKMIRDYLLTDPATPEWAAQYLAPSA